MKKNFLKITFLFITLILVVLTVGYAVSKERACTIISSERGGLESEGDRAMRNAKEFYDKKGYETISLKDPAPLTILSNATSSKIQLYCCHGNIGLLEFPSGGLTMGGYFESNGKEFYSIDSINWSNAKLVTLAACNTAGRGSSSSYSIASQIMKKGAQMTIGWYTEVNAYSMPDWLDNFHKEMEEGYDPLVALNRANNEYWYINGNVRNNLFSYKNISTISENNELKISQDNILRKKEIGKLTVSQIESKIKEKDLYFDSNNYDKNYSEGLYTFCDETNEMKHINSYIDYRLKIGDYIANSGYTVVIDNRGFVEQIIDHTINTYSNNQLATIKQNNNFLITEDDTIYYLNKAKENVNNTNNILEENINYYYDLNTNEKQAIVTLKVADNLTQFKLLTYTFEIEN